MSKEKPFSVTFYSYKGGTGRTTAAANVATYLAKQGKKVVCIDMDLEGPGLAVVFNVPDDSIETSLHHYLSEDSVSAQNLIISLKKVLNRSESWTENLFLVPGSTSFSKIIDYSDGNHLVNRINHLKKSINELFSPDFIILDSPNGYGDLAALSMFASDYLVVLFRWSRQHLLGTVRISEFTTRCGISFLPVASCVPAGNKDKKDKYLELLRSTIKLGEDFVEIADDNKLKWLETIILFDRRHKKYNAQKGYIEIANILMSKNINR